MTVAAVFATGTCACSCLRCEPESTVPMVQDASLLLPQPRLNAGFWLDGDVESLSLTSLTVPSGTHTLTFHLAVWPRVMLASSRCRLTHSCTGAGVEASVRAKLRSVAMADAPPSSWVTNAVVLAVCFALPAVRPLVSAEPDVPDGDGDGEVLDGLGDGDDGEGSGVMLGIGVVDLPGLGEVGVVPESVGLGLGVVDLHSSLTVPLTTEVCARAV